MRLAAQVASRLNQLLDRNLRPPRVLARTARAGQYQQAPTPLGGGMVKAAWFKNYAANELPDKFDQVVQSWDTAN